MTIPNSAQKPPRKRYVPCDFPPESQRDPHTTRGPVGAAFAIGMYPAPLDTHRKAAEHEALLRAMAVFCAVEAYRKEKGHLPGTLGELVPDYLPRVPTDPFDGKPLRYVSRDVPNLPADAWAIYSIGEDFTDDGGEAHSEGRAGRDGVANPDLVWPSCPYPRASEQD